MDPFVDDVVAIFFKGSDSGLNAEQRELHAKRGLVRTHTQNLKLKSG